MDHMMPEMDGIEAAGLIRAWEKGQREDGLLPERPEGVPIIALTANAVLGMKEMFMEKGFNDFLAKPIEVSKLDEMLVRWIPKEKRERGGKGGGVRRSGDSAASGLRAGSSNRDSPLPAIPGIDVKKGIEMTGGREAGYRTVLAMFGKDARDRLRLFEAGPVKLPVFVTQVHALKSAAASIGAAGLSGEAAALETAGRARDMAFIKGNFKSFLTRLAGTVKSIDKALGAAQAVSAQGGAEAPGPPPAFPVRLLRELEAALESRDAGGIDLVMEKLGGEPAGAETKAAVDQISDQVLMAEYGEAVATVKKLLAANN
jgi:CheY-like chemotaxis protein